MPECPDKFHTGWMQGSIIDDETSQRLLNSSEQVYGVILTQDCDVVHPIDTETFLDVVFGTMVECKPEYLYGKNPRILHLEVEEGSVSKNIELKANNRRIIEKSALLKCIPDSLQLNADALKTLRKWYTSRFVRPAFPDEFNRRLGVIQKKFDALMKKESSRYISAIWIALSTKDELQSEQVYEIEDCVTCRRDDLEKYEKEIYGFSDALEALIKTCPKIILGEEVLVLHHGQFTLEDIARYSRFSLEYRSLAPKPGGECAPE